MVLMAKKEKKISKENLAFFKKAKSLALKKIKAAKTEEEFWSAILTLLLLE